eukprot:318948-Amphidinium_carterae.1
MIAVSMSALRQFTSLLQHLVRFYCAPLAPARRLRVQSSISRCRVRNKKVRTFGPNQVLRSSRCPKSFAELGCAVSASLGFP